MGRIYEISNKIDELIQQKKMDKSSTRGKIGLKAGILLFFTEDTPDDPEKIAKIKTAIKEVLGEEI